VPGLYSLLAFVYAGRVVVRGRSMLPALRPDERVLFDRLAYALDRPRTGDIVLARHPGRPGVRMIKRVAERDGVGGAEYWLLGDNEGESTDSRTLGAFRRRDIVGRAWVVYWPPERFRVLGRIDAR
ncbi:MAG TPA: nickel-type superoxide dismutase maturation protease, partial [Dehalococcoidia bacterium]|nr:nickel-type superoxide dismutase maturation protease [Dehalococcoidia bacterium]